MKPLSLELGKPLFPHISISFKSPVKENRLTLKVCLLVFLLVSVFDCIVNISNNIFTEAILIGCLVSFNIVFSFISLNEGKKQFLLVFYLLTLIAVTCLLLMYGFSTGSYFYLFPSATIFIINTNGIKEKVKFNSSFFNGLVLFAWVALFFIFSFNSVRIFLFNNLFIFRLLVSVFISGLLIRYILSAFSVTDEKNIVNTNSDVLFQSNQEGYIVVDKETQEIVEYNQYAFKLFDLPEKTSLTGLYISQFMMRYLSPGSLNLDTLMNKLPDNWQGEGNFTTHTKREFSASINSFNFFNDDKEYQIISIRDNSEFKKTEKDLLFYKDKLDKSAQVKSRFLSSMSHELRTPLNGIIGSANLILAEQNLPEKIKSQTNLQLYSSEHMLSIINDILDFSKIESGKMEIKKHAFNLLEALHFLIKSVENQFTKNNVKLVYNFDPQLADVEIISDVVKLRQILFNLISNSLKFTIDGQVEIKAEIKNSDAEKLTVLFSVTDTGIGIKKEKQSEIFDDFVQVHDECANRKFGGTGLGLTICEKLINLLGGKIELESEFGKGACFYFTLSFDKAVKEMEIIPQQVKTEIYEAPVDIRGIRVLVVEDNEVNAAILIKFLQKWNIRIKEASNGIQALELLKFHKFDLILMDLEMPEMNGYNAVKIIRKTNTEIPVIAFTATLLENMDSLINEYGFTDYILKPFKPSDLKKKIEKYAIYRKIEYA